MRTYRPHVMGRPHGRCTACGARYPCGPAKAILLHEYANDRAALCVLLAMIMVDAIDDAYKLHPSSTVGGGIYERFLAWVPRNSPGGPIG